MRNQKKLKLKRELLKKLFINYHENSRNKLIQMLLPSEKKETETDHTKFTLMTSKQVNERTKDVL